MCPCHKSKSCLDSWVLSSLSSCAHLVAWASWPLPISSLLRCSDCKLILLKQSSRLRRQDPRCSDHAADHVNVEHGLLQLPVLYTQLYTCHRRESNKLLRVLTSRGVLSWRCQFQEFIYRPAIALGSWRLRSKGEANEKKPPWRLSRNAWAVCLPWWQMTWLHSCLQGALVASISYISSHCLCAEVCTHGRLEHLTQLVVQEAAGLDRLSSARDLNVNINLVILSLPICRMGAKASAFAQPAVLDQASNAHRTALGSSQLPGGSTHPVSRTVFPTAFATSHGDTIPLQLN